MPRPLSDWRDRIRKFFDEGDPEECWPWKGTVRGDGYAHFRMGGKGSRNIKAHVAVWLLLRGEIGEGLVLDHECHNRDVGCRRGEACPHRKCVNPSHMEPVPGVVNTMRGHGAGPTNLAKTRCPKGHLYDRIYSTVSRYADGRRTYRACSVCRNAAMRAKRATR